MPTITELLPAQNTSKLISEVLVVSDFHVGTSILGNGPDMGALGPVSKRFLTGWLIEKNGINCAVSKSLVPKRGLEPPLPDGNYTLNVARLPIPPLRHMFGESRSCNRARMMGRIAPVATFNLAIQPRPCQARALRVSSPIRNVPMRGLCVCFAWQGEFVPACKCFMP